MSKISSTQPFKPDRKIVESACRTLGLASHGISAMEAQFASGDFAAKFVRVVDVIMNLQGRVIITGMGKSGIVARKMTATLNSTGTPAIFMHPGDAGHGDLGMLTSDDVVLMLSHSGESKELAPIIRYCKRFGFQLIGLTARPQSTVATASDICLLLPAVREASSNELAPTTSTTVQMAFGDALAVALMEVRDFSAEDFYKFHPNGRLGAQLVRVRQLMAAGDELPRVHEDASLLDATIEMTRGRLGCTAIVNEKSDLIGVFTDGDLRRTVIGTQCLTEPVSRYMTVSPVAVDLDELASEALLLMHLHNITLLFVCEGRRLIGAIHLHQLSKAGVA